MAVWFTSTGLHCRSRHPSQRSGVIPSKVKSATPSDLNSVPAHRLDVIVFYDRTRRVRPGALRGFAPAGANNRLFVATRGIKDFTCAEIGFRL